MNGRTSRRQLFGGSASLMLLTAAAAGTAEAQELRAGGVQAGAGILWSRYLRARDAAEVAATTAENLRSQLVARWGDLSRGMSAEAVWGHDPQYRLLTPANLESDRLGNEEADCLDDLLACPSSSITEVRQKLAAVLHVWRQHGDVVRGDGEYHEQIAMAFLEDAQRILGTPSDAETLV